MIFLKYIFTELSSKPGEQNSKSCVSETKPVLDDDIQPQQLKNLKAVFVFLLIAIFFI